MSEERKTMDRDTYLKVVALLHMAKGHKRKVDDYQAALEATLGENLADHIAGTHSGDAVWEDYSADDLISRCGFDVAKEWP